jgi:ATP-dependent DNA ligase
MPRPRFRPLSRLIEPCLPRRAAEPPAGPGWLHEIKHDGFRIMARRDGRGVRLFTRNGYNFADRFPKILEAVSNLPARTCLIDDARRDGVEVQMTKPPLLLRSNM